MKRELFLFVLLPLMLLNLNTSCDKDSDNTEVADTNFIITDYEPVIVVNKDDTVTFDINQDGKDDFTVYHDKVSGFTYLKFKSVSENCLLGRKYILEGDTINNNLSFLAEHTWIIEEDHIYNGTAYLPISIKSDSVFNFGWIYPSVKDVNSSNHYIIIDKTAYCKIRNKEILAGQEKIGE